MRKKRKKSAAMEKAKKHPTEDDVFEVTDIQELIILVGQASAALRKAQEDNAKAHRTLLKYVAESTVRVKDRIAQLRGNDGTETGSDGKI
jgi:hypothetical protein